MSKTTIKIEVGDDNSIRVEIDPVPTEPTSAHAVATTMMRLFRAHMAINEGKSPKEEGWIDKDGNLCKKVVD